MLLVGLDLFTRKPCAIGQMRVREGDGYLVDLGREESKITMKI